MSSRGRVDGIRAVDVLRSGLVGPPLVLGVGLQYEVAYLRRRVADLREAILAYVAAHNEKGRPFAWTKTADEILDKIRRFGLRTQQVHAQ